jgi:cobalt-zinc-cadmium efflux system membrane fusion protein
MNRPLLFALIISSLMRSMPSAWADAQVLLSKQEIDNLGIALITPRQTGEIPLVQAPARVTIPPSQEYVVSAPYAGLVQSVDAALGQQVEKGARLAQINSPELLALQRDLLNNNSALQLAAAQMRRDQALFLEGIIAKRRWQETKSQYNRQNTLVNEAKQTLVIAGMSHADVGQLLHSGRLSGTLNVKAPATGVILEKNIVAGQRVDALSPLFRLASLAKLWLDISLPQERLPEIGPNDRVTVEGSAIQARIILIGQSVNPDNQTVLVRAVIDRPDGTLRPGQKVAVRLFKPAAQGLLSVPASALMQAKRRSYVFVPIEGGFEARPVTVAGREGGLVTIAAGLQPGEPVVAKGVVALKAAWLGLGGGE